MDTLVSIGVLAATLWSLWVLVADTLRPAGDGMGPGLYFEVGAVVTTLLLAGRYAEHRSRRRAGDALRALLSLGAKDAERIMLGPDGTPLRLADGGWRTTAVPVAALQVGDVFAVRPGGTVATDGTVVEGAPPSSTTPVTGEPVPVDVMPGNDVVGETVSTSEHLLVRATAWARTRCWLVSVGSWPRRRRARPPWHGSRTASPRCSCRWCSCWPC